MASHCSIIHVEYECVYNDHLFSCCVLGHFDGLGKIGIHTEQTQNGVHTTVHKGLEDGCRRGRIAVRFSDHGVTGGTSMAEAGDPVATDEHTG